jgi:DNA-binding NtrC family response regulator
MGYLLRVLVVEDDDADGQILVRELSRGGYDVDIHCVQTCAAMEKALFHKVWDIIFCDDNLSKFSVMGALATLQESRHNYPFFLRSGTAGEETVVTIFQRVADDFLVKQSLVPLLPSLAKVLQEIQSRRSQKPKP